MKQPLPPELEPVKERALRALGPVKPAGSGTRADKDFLFTAMRTDAGRSLPNYYLVYFLLVDLMGFQNLGKFEKIAWSVPIDFEGEAFLIEHRKFGLGLFAKDLEQGEEAGRRIVTRIQKAVKAARPFFDWIARQAVLDSRVNVVNNSSALFDRYTYLLDAYRAKAEEAARRVGERIIEEGKAADGGVRKKVSVPWIRPRQEAEWLALAAVEAFFGWTEHVFIHIAILSGALKTASQVSDLAAADWPEKFRAALDISEPEAKGHFDRLLTMRRELRNHVAHGAFGKDGEAFRFHSGAGAVPVLLPHRVGSKRFTLGEGLSFNVDAALGAIEGFTAFIWTGNRAPAKVYLQKSGLPVILTMAADGTYTEAMRSIESMKELMEHLSYLLDQAANMDW